MNTVNYSEGARGRIEDYLGSVLSYLNNSNKVDAREVVEDLRGHIERELLSAEQPVTEDAAKKVLDRLGPPEQYLDEGELTPWRKMILTLRRGPEDWRLAYLSFVVLFVGTLLTGPIGIIASFLLSRASITIAKEPNPPAKKWLIYPGLVAMYFLISVVVLFWPGNLGMLIMAFTEQPRDLLWKAKYFDSDGLGTVMGGIAIGFVALAIWWTVLWGIVKVKMQAFRTLFTPFAENWNGRFIGILALIGWFLGLALTCGTVLLWLNADRLR